MWYKTGHKLALSTAGTYRLRNGDSAKSSPKGIEMRFVVVTGMSGAGKSTAIKILEDEGFYCVDNMPVRLIEMFEDLIFMPGSEYTKVALGVDVRSDEFENIQSILSGIESRGHSLEIVFMDADDSTLIRRYKETRRAHPLSPNGRIKDGIDKEREMLRDLKKKASYIFDTTSLLTRELRSGLVSIFSENKAYNSLIVTVMSFGFKHGIPSDADLVFDVRFLPNPFYIEELRHLTGNDREVQEFLGQYAETGEFLEKLGDMVEYLLPYYVREGKNRLVIAIGCTGGHHRSVTVANALFDRLKEKENYGVNIFHRDIDH